MNAGWEQLIPEPQHDAVRAALAAAYGQTSIITGGPVLGGASGAILLRITARDRAHLLRVEARRSPLRNPHQYACMEIAASQGLAPALHYVDADNGVMLMDWIDTRPLLHYPGGASALAGALGELTMRLQDAPLFPALGDWRMIVGRLLDLLESRFLPGLLDRHREAFEQLVTRIDWESRLHKSSHNDPNFRNLLFDGERLWLVDWETAYRNDPMVDIAIMADNLAATFKDDHTVALLSHWLGRAPGQEELERLEDIRRLTRLYYAGLLIGFVGGSGGKLADTATMSPAQFEARLKAGDMSATQPETLVTIGKMRLADFLQP